MLSKDDIRTWGEYVKSVIPIKSKKHEGANKTRTKLSKLDARLALKRKKYEDVVEIDLHGISTQNAYNLCMDKIEEAYENGTRRMRFITGKSGQIKFEFPIWLQNNKFISNVTQSAPKNGGDGSFDVTIAKK